MGITMLIASAGNPNTSATLDGSPDRNFRLVKVSAP
jgi:hypothetical protein